MQVAATRPEQQKLLNRLPQLLQDGRFCDISLSCNDGITVEAHRLVLSMASQPLQALVSFNNRDAIQLDVSSTVLNTVLRYIYNGEARVPLDSIVEIIQFTHMYELQGMLDQVVGTVVERLEPDLCMELMTAFRYHRIEDIDIHCTQFAVSFFHQCMYSPAFVHCSAGMLLRLLEQDALNVPDEETVLKSILIWLGDESDRHRRQEACFIFQALRFELLSQATRDRLCEAVPRLGPLGQTINELLQKTATYRSDGIRFYYPLYQHQNKVRRTFRGPYADWGCAVREGKLKAGTGTPGDSKDELHLPRSIAIAPVNEGTYVYIGDNSNNRVVLFFFASGTEPCLEQYPNTIVAGTGCPVNGTNLVDDAPDHMRVAYNPATGELLVIQNGDQQVQDGQIVVFTERGQGDVMAVEMPNQGLVRSPLVQDMHIRSDGLIFFLVSLSHELEDYYTSRSTHVRTTHFYVLVRSRSDPLVGAGHIAADLGVWCDTCDWICDNGDPPTWTKAPPDFFHSLWVTMAGDIYVSCPVKNIVQKWTLNEDYTGTETHIGTTVAGDHWSYGTSMTELNNPQGIFVDEATQMLYIADTGDNRVVRWELGAHSGELVAGNGNCMAGSELHELDHPSATARDLSGGVYIVDTGNSRVVRWGPAPPPPDTTALVAEFARDGAASTQPIVSL